MKFVSWNVNGLRACIQKGFLDRFSEMNADFFCLQETKLSDGQLKLDLPGYEQYWCYAEKKGYSGTAIFTKHTPLSVSYGIGEPELDHEGRVITLEYREFYLVTCYTPNAQRGLSRLDHRMTWDDAFRAYLQKLDETKPVVLCGDLNVAHQEIDLKNPQSNRGNAGFSDEERQSFQKTLDLGFTDTFRHLYPDAAGRYSWWSYMYHARENNAGWRIDYFLVSDRLKDQIHRADIHSDILGSDHCPVSLELDTFCNGGIWSPDPAGKPKILFPEEKPKKEPKNEPKASAVSAKALTTLFLICAVVLMAAFLFNPFKRLLPEPGPDFHPFEVEKYYLPLYEASSSEHSGCTVIQSTDATFYTKEEDYSSSIPIGEANSWLRVELTDEGIPYAKADWTLTPVQGSPAVSSVQFAIFDTLSCVPYYSDPTCKSLQGWLVWGHASYGKVLPLVFSMPSGEDPYTQNVTIATYLTAQQADSLPTMDLLRHVLEHEDIYNILTAPLKAGMSDTEYNAWIMADTSCSVYPAYTELLTRSDAVEPLMNAAYGTDGWLNYALLHHDYICSFMTNAQEIAFLIGDYENCPNKYLGTDIAPDETNTASLFRYLMDSRASQMLLQATTTESAQQILNYLAVNDPLLDYLQRSDGVVANLMAMHVESDDSSKELIDRLLSLSPYRYMMTPYEEYLYLTCKYPNCPFEPTGPDYTLWDSADLTTSQLLQRVCNLVSGSSAFRRANHSETLYYIYLDLLVSYPELYDLMYREDLEAILRPKAEEIVYITGSGTTVNIYRQLLNLYEYIQANGEIYALSTEDLVQRLLRDPYMEESWYQLSSHSLTSYTISENFFRIHPLILDLLSREDAISALMNCANEEKSMLPHYLLGAPYFAERMTPNQRAMFLTCRYSSHPYQDNSASLIDTEKEKSMSTAELLSAMSTQTDILLFFEKCDTLDTMYHLYELQKDSWPYLKELMNRSDAMQVLAAFSEEHPIPPGSSLNIYDRLIMLHQFITQWDSSDTSAEALLSSIFNDDVLLASLEQIIAMDDASRYEAFKNLRETDIRFSLILQQEDAVDVLMYCAPPAGECTKMIPYYLLTYFLRGNMTAEQEAKMIAGLYNSCPFPFSFSMHCEKDVRKMETYDLVYFIDLNGAELYQYLYQCESGAARGYMYQLLRDYSNVLLELETRSDALRVLESHSFNSNNTLSPVRYLSAMWPSITVDAS